MTDRRASMMATLADIRSKPSTPGRQAAAANIEAALAKMEAYAARAKGGAYARQMTLIDRERLMQIVDDLTRADEARSRAHKILDGNGDLIEGDVQFLERRNGGGAATS